MGEAAMHSHFHPAAARGSKLGTPTFFWQMDFLVELWEKGDLNSGRLSKTLTNTLDQSMGSNFGFSASERKSQRPHFFLSSSLHLSKFGSWTPKSEISTKPRIFEFKFPIGQFWFSPSSSFSFIQNRRNFFGRFKNFPTFSSNLFSSGKFCTFEFFDGDLML